MIGRSRALTQRRWCPLAKTESFSTSRRASKDNLHPKIPSSHHQHRKTQEITTTKTPSTRDSWCQYQKSISKPQWVLRAQLQHPGQFQLVWRKHTPTQCCGYTPLITNQGYPEQKLKIIKDTDQRSNSQTTDVLLRKTVFQPNEWCKRKTVEFLGHKNPKRG